MEIQKILKKSERQLLLDNNNNDNINNNTTTIDNSNTTDNTEIATTNNNTNLYKSILPKKSNDIQYGHEMTKFLKFGNQHAILVNQNNEIYIYGENGEGQLGLNNEEIERIDQNFTKLNKYYKKNINFGNIIHVECGDDFTIIVNNLNEFYFTGNLDILKSNKFIKMDIKLKKEEKIKFIRCGCFFFFVVMTDGTVYGYGRNNKGQLGLKKEIISLQLLTKIPYLDDFKIKDIQCGCDHTILLDNLNNIYTTGWNKYGQLGLNDFEDRFEFTKVNLDFKIENIYCNMNYTFIKNKNGDIYGNGFNKYGQLGTGDNENKKKFTKINFNLEPIDCIIKSFAAFNIIKTKNNNLYISGDNEDEITGLSESFCKLDFSYYFDSFVKLDYFRTNKKYIYPILLYEELIIATSDYRINGEKEENNLLAVKCLQKLQNEQLTDISVVFDTSFSYTLGKRKRINENLFIKDKNLKI